MAAHGRLPAPGFVLVAALLVPGAGQVLNRRPVRGLVYLFFMLLLGGFTLITAAPDISLVGKLSGGLFVHAVAVYEAYRTARLRSEIRRNGTGREASASVGR